MQKFLPDAGGAAVVKKTKIYANGAPHVMATGSTRRGVGYARASRWLAARVREREVGGELALPRSEGT